MSFLRVIPNINNTKVNFNSTTVEMIGGLKTVQ